MMAVSNLLCVSLLVVSASGYGVDLQSKLNKEIAAGNRAFEKKADIVVGDIKHTEETGYEQMTHLSPFVDNTIEDTYDTESAIAVEKMEKGVNELKEAGEHRDEQIETLVRPQISKATDDVVKATQLKKERFVNPGTAILPLYE